jgi:hypothetical protein
MPDMRLRVDAPIGPSACVSESNHDARPAVPSTPLPSPEEVLGNTSPAWNPRHRAPELTAEYVEGDGNDLSSGEPAKIVQVIDRLQFAHWHGLCTRLS